MNVIKTKLSEVLILEPKVYEDSRGFFKEIYQAQRYAECNIGVNFVQDNYSRSRKDVLRGLHFQVSKPQGKLVSCLKGAVYDVVVDINVNSSTFGQYIGVELNEKNHLQVWIPPGYAHGFCVLTNTADFQYKCTDYYDPFDEGGIIWNDKDLAIEWPTDTPFIANKDLNLPTFQDLVNKK